MITYLVNFTLCSALMLLAYQLLLKNKAMYRFNRLYLLGSILFSLTVPLIVVERPAPIYTADRDPQPEIAAYQVLSEVSAVPQTAIQSVKFNPADYAGTALVSIYALISAALLYRFGKNLYNIGATISRNKTVPYRDARLVLIPQKLTPHTFLDCIFLNNDEYLNQQVDDAVLQHELAHARQRHTVDVIVIELLQVFCWFNPVLLLYRKAIRLNHEFLADDAVLSANYNVINYQTLLVNKLTDVRSLGITSQFNYSVTKKRLMMMTKKTSATAAWISRLALMPVLIIAFILFCNKTEAVERMVNKVAKQMDDTVKARKTVTGKQAPMRIMSMREFNSYPHTKDGVSKTMLDEYVAIEQKYDMIDMPSFNNFHKITEVDKNRMMEIYQRMSMDQQSQQRILFNYPGKPAPPKQPSLQQLQKWAISAKTYGVWINEKRVANVELAKYKPEDFSGMWTSNLTDRAVKRDHFNVQVGLMTTKYYDQLLHDAEVNKGKSLMLFRGNTKMFDTYKKDASANAKVTTQTPEEKTGAAIGAQQVYKWVDYRYLAPGFADLRKKEKGC